MKKYFSTETLEQLCSDGNRIINFPLFLFFTCLLLKYIHITSNTPQPTTFQAATQLRFYWGGFFFFFLMLEVACFGQGVEGNAVI